MPKRLIKGGALSAVTIVCALAVSASGVGAQSALPTGWSSRDIGTVGLVGSASVASGTWTIDAQWRQYLGHVGRVQVRVSAGQRRPRHSRARGEPRECRRLVQGRRDDSRVAGREFAQRVHARHAWGRARVPAPQQHGRFDDADRGCRGHGAGLASPRQAGQSRSLAISRRTARRGPRPAARRSA